MFKTGLTGPSLVSKPRLLAHETVSHNLCRQLTPVIYNHRFRWLAAVSPRDRFFCSDTSGCISS